MTLGKQDKPIQYLNNIINKRKLHLIETLQIKNIYNQWQDSSFVYITKNFKLCSLSGNSISDFQIMKKHLKYPYGPF